MKLGGVSIKTVIGKDAKNLKTVTNGAYNLTFTSQPNPHSASSENKSSLKVIDVGGPFLTIKVPLKDK